MFMESGHALPPPPCTTSIAYPCTKLCVALKLRKTGGSQPLVVHRFCVFEVRKHGGRIFNVKLGFATIHVRVMWSTLDIDKRFLGQIATSLPRTRLIGLSNSFSWRCSNYYFLDLLYLYQNFLLCT